MNYCRLYPHNVKRMLFQELTAYQYQVEMNNHFFPLEYQPVLK